MVQYEKPKLIIVEIDEDIVTASLGDLNNGDDKTNTLPLWKEGVQ